ncbi:MAG TPA: hypothetical protein VE135_27745 [Pyrinomonadaceae bacterium]|nr:hypothetical protein [Pyrinomonadaceae bacterium]
MSKGFTLPQRSLLPWGQSGAAIIGDAITVYYKAGTGAWTAIETCTDSTYSGMVRLGWMSTARQRLTILEEGLDSTN